MKLEHFGCKKMEGIYQEFYAHIFLLNMVSILENEAQRSIDVKVPERKYKYKYNWQNAYRYVRDKIVALINNRNMYKILNDLIKKIKKQEPNKTCPSWQIQISNPGTHH